MDNTTHYQIKEFDTLESIAGRYLGDPERWPEIVVNNDLRYPFISKEDQYQYGVELEFGALGAPLLAGASQVSLALYSTQLATAKGVLLIEQYSSTGAVISEAKVLSQPGVDSYINGYTDLHFTEPMKKSFDEFARWTLFSNPELQTSKVAKPGDILILRDSLVGDKRADMDQFTKLLGTDVALDEHTRQLAWDSKKHDLATVSGVPNLQQALRLKIMTNQGDLVYHPNYGDALLQFVGAANTPVLVSMAPGLIRQCLLQDPRLFAVESVIASIENDVLQVELQARVRGLDTLIQVTSLGIELR